MESIKTAKVNSSKTTILISKHKGQNKGLVKFQNWYEVKKNDANYYDMFIRYDIFFPLTFSKRAYFFWGGGLSICSYVLLKKEKKEKRKKKKKDRRVGLKMFTILFFLQM